MTQAVERERAHAATAVRGALADNAAFDVRLVHPLAELLAEQTRPAPGQCRKEILVVQGRCWQQEQMVFQRRMNDGHDLRAGLPHVKADGLDLGDKIDIAPANVRAIEETLS